jgi:hypothetical protein
VLITARRRLGKADMKTREEIISRFYDIITDGNVYSSEAEQADEEARALELAEKLADDILDSRREP